MKKIIAVLFTMVFLMSFSSCDSSEKVEFKDKIVEAVVREELDKKYSSITRDELLTIKKLNFPSLEYGQEITTFEDLLLCENLESLYLMKTRITDVSVFSKFENLTTIDISYNPIEDISALEDMPQLKYISVNGLELVTDFSPLGKLSRLRVVYAVNNKNLTDISFAKELEMLDRLDITGCNVSDLSPLKDLNRLKNLYLDGENITDWTSVSHVQYVSDRPEGLYVERDFDPAVYDNSTKITMEEVQKELKVNGKTLSYPVTLKSLGEGYYYDKEFLSVMYDDEVVFSADFKDVGYGEVPDENSVMYSIIFFDATEETTKYPISSDFDFKGINLKSTEDELVEKLGKPNIFNGEFDSSRTYIYYIDEYKSTVIVFIYRDNGSLLTAGFTFLENK